MHYSRKAYTAMYIAFTITGVLGALAYWVGASISLCGISGCSGGGFGVSYDPEGTLYALVVSGIIASLPGFIASIHLKSWRWLIAAFVLLVGMPIAGSLVVGVDLSGYPTRYPRYAE
jgi:hypothetical protein